MKRLVLVLSSVDSKETLERWEFNVEYEKEEGDGEIIKPSASTENIALIGCSLTLSLSSFL